MSISPALLPGRFEAWAGGYLARALVALPTPIVRRLAGAAPPEAAGLHPEALLLGKLAEIGRDPMSDAAPVAEQRRRLALTARPMGIRPALPLSVSDLRAGEIPVRLYAPHAAPTPGPLLMYFHGGGYRLGAAAAWASFAGELAARAAARVVVVDYRLAPEHPFPAALHDAVAVAAATGRKPEPAASAACALAESLATSLPVLSGW